ncbi:hypothetical protein DFH06DRAFT_1325312 [Mycena polygramma]|nr:hypothetical protein DFH06DRAFT_1325312 [Mycena polygramma]
MQTQCAVDSTALSEYWADMVADMTATWVASFFYAGRIWWIRREALNVGADDTIRSRYSSVIAMIVESGALYCATTILLAITYFLPGTAFLMAQAAAMHLVDIAPTIILVRVGLGCENSAGSSACQHTLRLPVRQVLNRAHSQVSVLQIKPRGEDVDF